MVLPFLRAASARAVLAVLALAVAVAAALAAVDISLESTELCFPSQLIDRVLLHGVGRCNLHQQLATVDPVLRDDSDKIIELIESRHIMTVNRLMNDPTLIVSNRLKSDTLHYLRQLSDGLDSVYLYFPLWEKRIRQRDPTRLSFIKAAARKNDFRRVLRTNPTCGGGENGELR